MRNAVIRNAARNEAVHLRDIAELQKTADQNADLLLERGIGRGGVLFAERVKIETAEHCAVGDRG